MNDFFLELYLILPLFLLLKNAPKKTLTQKCIPRLPNDLQNESQMDTKLDFFPKWIRCESTVEKKQEKPIVSVRFGQFFEFKKRSDFFLELYLLLPLCLLLKKLPRRHLDTEMLSQGSQIGSKIMQK